MASGSSSALNLNSKVREGIWNAVVSLKCKKLLWFACKELLPVRSLLLRKGIIKYDVCPCCGTCKETTMHALLLCEGVKRFWLASPLGLRVDSWHNVANITMSQWVDQCLDVLDEKAMGMLCAMMWGLWYRRNVWVIRNKKLGFPQVMDMALSGFVIDEWIPPSDSKVKANFSAVAIDYNGTGLGVVFRNSKGELVASGTDFLTEYYDPEIAVTLCYKWAMEKSDELWFPEVIFETDCEELYTQWKILIQGNNNTTGNTSYLNEILDECIIMMQNASLTLVDPKANKVAHCLAELAFNYGERVWVENVPVEASECLQADAAKIANFDCCAD